MSEELTSEQRAAVDALKALRGSCPAAETLIEYEALDEPARARHAAHAHIQICSRCQLVMLHVGGAGGAGGAGWKTWALPMAAVLVLAVGAAVMSRRDAASIVPADTVRGTELQVTVPAGAVEIVREFRWQSPIQADRYRVVVRRGGTVIWQGETAGLSLAPPPSGVIERDVQYEWLVEAIDREGNVRMTSPPQPFVVY